MTDAAETSATGGIGLSSAVFILAAVAATAASLTGVKALTVLASSALVLFVALEVHRVPLAQKIAAGALVATAIVLAVRAGTLRETFVLGVERTLPFLLIFASIGWLRSGAGESPSVHRLRAALSGMGPGRRFAALSLSSHGLGAAFNLAGMALLAPMLDDSRDSPRDGQRLRCAILWGFSAATCWSPFYVGTAAVLAALPGLSWVQIVPYGLLLAAGFLLWATLYDRVRRPRRAAVAPLPGGALAAPLRRLSVAVVVLYALVLSLVEGLGLPLTTAIALAGPSYALGWMALVHGRTDPGRVTRIAGSVLAGYRGMRTETTLFTAANVFGVAIAGALPHLDEGAGLMALSTGSVFADALLLIWGYMAICALGIHPVVLLVVFTTVTDPASLGLPLPLMGAAMMALWGMGTAVSPLSGTTLYMSQMSQVSSFAIAWRWNGLFYALGAVWLAAVIALAA
ncbi:hypothetical protein [Maliponia aquimaris]|uniref:Citrate transporter n=1 Tax=Maliponia aquimaris TaxID=1673631 RepID=A0A238L0F4_9RHOB|nr:hypothetical protein [Maliponia aquimaris]SMX48564.1 hypothetical protein MAA8898_03996 [Maliponia aquimaris]